MIESSLAVPAATAAEIMARYPLSAYPSPPLAFAAVGTDDSFACDTLTADESVSKYVPTYSYEFNDENAPERYEPPVGFPYGAAHESEVQYLFSLRNTPYSGVLTAQQESLAATMQAYWTRNFCPRTVLPLLEPCRRGIGLPVPGTKQCRWTHPPLESKQALALTTTAPVWRSVGCSVGQDPLSHFPLLLS